MLFWFFFSFFLSSWGRLLFYLTTRLLMGGVMRMYGSLRDEWQKPQENLGVHMRTIVWIYVAIDFFLLYYIHVLMLSPFFLWMFFSFYLLSVWCVFFFFLIVFMPLFPPSPQRSWSWYRFLMLHFSLLKLLFPFLLYFSYGRSVQRV